MRILVLMSPVAIGNGDDNARDVRAVSLILASKFHCFAIFMQRFSCQQSNSKIL